MTRDELFGLFELEREYEESIFGNYKENQALGLPSFIIFLKKYVDKMIDEYTSVWTSDLPPWLISCRESEIQNKAPVKVYEELIKVMALAGAALEAYADIDVAMWRHEGAKPKWKGE